jgi:hypothetical protein
MDAAASFLPILQVMTAVMTAPTAETFQTLIVGWLMSPRRTIMGMVRGSGTDRHHAAFHRLFAAASWSIDRAGLAVFDLITRGVLTVFLTIDDTLLPRHGLKIFGTGMHRDALLSSRSHTVVRWGHCWVVLCVVIQSRHCPGRHFSLPVLCRLYLNHKAAEKWKRSYYSKSELMLQMLSKLDQHVRNSGKTLHLLGDSAFTAPTVLAQMPRSIQVTGRVVSNVRIRTRAAETKSDRPGRPATRGDRLPNPAQMLQGQRGRRMTIKLYDGSTYYMRVVTQVGRFYKSSDRNVLVIAVEHLRGGRGTEVFYTTDIEANVETVLQRYSWRWSIEVMFHECKGHLGIDEPQNRTRQAARRTASTGFLLYSLIVWWHETTQSKPARSVRTWTGKKAPSFADMLAALRTETLQNMQSHYFSTPDIPPRVHKFLEYLQLLIAMAA